MNEKGICAIGIIKPESFYANESEKTKLNWFCYELSMVIYGTMKQDLGSQLKKHRIDDRTFADFSVHLSRKMKIEILKKLSGQIKNVCISYEMIESCFPGIDDRLLDQMLDAVSSAWDRHMDTCVICPTRCISERNIHCTMFNDTE
ncbi:MAG: hypothetical protein ABIG84_06285 [archaeon]